MLIKLMKYEWKATWKACAIINFFTVFATILGVFAMKSLQNGILHKDQFTYIAVILFVFYYLSIIGVSFSMSIYIGVRFYCNLYTDEGYLMHTLPVTKRQLVLSAAGPSAGRTGAFRSYDDAGEIHSGSNRRYGHLPARFFPLQYDRRCYRSDQRYLIDLLCHLPGTDLSQA